MKKLMLSTFVLGTLAASSFANAEESHFVGNYHLTQGINGSLLLEPTEDVGQPGILKLSVEGSDTEMRYVFTAKSNDGAIIDPEKPEKTEFLNLGPASSIEYAEELCATRNDANKSWHVLAEDELTSFVASGSVQPMIMWLEGVSLADGVPLTANAALGGNGTPYTPYYVSGDLGASLAVVCSNSK
ncbi:TPA: hypothetical protein ACX6RR_000123 [Photobacterium damselae]